jgi:hypothetical protein
MSSSQLQIGQRRSEDFRRDRWTPRFVESREQVLGRRWWISHDPAVAAGQLAQQLGSDRKARAFVTAVLDALERAA